jgi:YVTN family beta-propeller protein
MALDERGLEPSRDLRELERSILNQDPGLDSTVGRGVPARPRGRSRRLAAVVGVGVAALAAAVVAGVSLHGGGSERPLSALEADSVAQIDAHSGLVQRSFAVGKTPTNVVVTPAAAWITSFDDRTVTRVDLHSGGEKVVGSPSTPTAIAAGGDGVWVISSFDGTVERLDGSGAGVLAVLRLRAGLKDVAADQRGVWVTNGARGTVTEIDPGTNEVIATVGGLANPAGVAIGANRIWIAEAGTNRVDALTPTGKLVLRVQLELEPSEIAFGDGAVWVTNPRDSTVTRIDPYSRRKQIVSVGARPSHVAVGGDHVWVTLDRDHSLVELDGRNGTLQRRLTLASPEQLNRGHTITPGGLSASSNSAWISIQGY